MHLFTLRILFIINMYKNEKFSCPQWHDYIFIADGIIFCLPCFRSRTTPRQAEPSSRVASFHSCFRRRFIFIGVFIALCALIEGSPPVASAVVGMLQGIGDFVERFGILVEIRHLHFAHYMCNSTGEALDCKIYHRLRTKLCSDPQIVESAVCQI